CDGSGHDPPYTCFLASDSMDLSAATRYVQQFRQYATPDDGALDFLMQIQAPMRPKTAAALRTGNALTLGQAMRAEHYFTMDPTAYATSIQKRAQDVADALGVPCAWTWDGSGV